MMKTEKKHKAVIKRLFIGLLLGLLPLTSVQAAKTIKIATLSPEGTYWMKQMRAGAAEIKAKTNGRVKFKFYPGGVMGNDENVLRKMRVGQLHGGAITIGSLSATVPDTTLYGLPFIFSSLEEAEKIRKTTDPMLSREMEDKGFVNFGFAQGGFTYLMSVNEVHNFEDVRKQKSWVPENSDVALSVFEYIGVTPISLPLSDVLTGLQTGLINTIFTSPIGALALQWHTHINHVVDMPLNYLAATMIIDKKVFGKLSEADQNIVREVMTRVYRNIDDRNKKDNIAAREAMIKKGVQFHGLSQADRAEWLKAGDFVIEKMRKKYNYTPALYEAVMAGKKSR